MKLHKNPQLRGLATAGVLCVAASLMVVGDAKPAKASPFSAGVQVRIGDFRIGARYDDRNYRGRYPYNAYPYPEPYPVAVPAPYPVPVPAPYPAPYPEAYPYPAPYSSAYPYPVPVPEPYPVPAPYVYSVPAPCRDAYPYGGYSRNRYDRDDWRYRRR